jgi:hypothetical protein
VRGFLRGPSSPFSCVQVVRTGFRAPVLVLVPDGLGMQLPPDLSVAEVVRVIKPSFRVPVIDVVSQHELPSKMTLGAIADYFASADDRCVACVHRTGAGVEEGIRLDCVFVYVCVVAESACVLWR